MAQRLPSFTELHNSVDLLSDSTARRATQLGKFTLWHNGRRTKPGLMHSPGAADLFLRLWRTILKNMKAFKSKLKFNIKLLKDERFGRFRKHRSMYALRRLGKLFKRWTLYEDRIFDLRLKTFERWMPRTQESPHELARQSEAKRRQAPQSEAKVCRHKCNLKKTSLINCTGQPIMHSTPNGN